jgi:hypothetical protein
MLDGGGIAQHDVRRFVHHCPVGVNLVDASGSAQIHSRLITHEVCSRRGSDSSQDLGWATAWGRKNNTNAIVTWTTRIGKKFRRFAILYLPLRENPDMGLARRFARISLRVGY